MKRMHVHVAVDDVAESVRFYRVLFAAEPTVRKSDYAKWMLDDPRVNFAISQRGADAGIEHLGIQVESADELHEVYDRLQQAGRPVIEEGATTCCYAKSEKSWIADPQGIAWETFLTSGDSTFYGDSPDLAPLGRDAGCCTPQTLNGECCPPKADRAADAPCCGTSQAMSA
jgi:catechol 2,3-dioxygenase-like lactoylglutathione lyase family enzyme